MNENFLRELQDSAEDAEIVEDNMSSVDTAAGTINYKNDFDIDEFLKRKFQEYSNMNRSNSTKRGCNPKAIKARRKKNKNKKTHRK